MHTGRIVSGTTVYIPRWVQWWRMSARRVAEGVPPFVLIGYPNVSRGAGIFWGARGRAYLYLNRYEPGGRQVLSRPDGITPGTASRGARRCSASLRQGKGHGTIRG